MPWRRLCWNALRVRPVWSALAMALFAAGLAALPWRETALAGLRAWEALPGVPLLLDLVRPFGRGEVAVLIALTIGAAGWRRQGGALLAGLLACAVLVWALKLAVPLSRPNGDAFAFVSGDTATAFCLLPLLLRRHGLGPAMGAALAILAVGTGLARIVQGYHCLADVLSGAGVGLFAGVLGAAVPVERCRAVRSPRLWLALAGLGWVAAAAWAWWGPHQGWLPTFVTVWGAPLLAWAAWPHLRRWHALGRLRSWQVGVALGLVLTALALSATLWDRDEPRNAQAAREMVAGGSLVVPTFDGEARLHKPILPYWLMAACLHLPLPPDVACRLPAVLAMAAAVLLLARTARLLAPDRPAVPAAAALALAASPLVLVAGSAATTDAVLMLGIAATMWLLVARLVGRGVRWAVPLAGAAIGWALLAKGPMALVVPVAAMLALTACGRLPAARGLAIARAWGVLLPAIAIGMALALAWFLPADAATGGRIWSEMVLRHVGERVLVPMESHGGPPWYYLPVLLAGCAAWLPALAAAVRGCAPRAVAADPARLVLIAWALPVLAVLSLVATKLPHYLLPMLWPVAVLLALSATGSEAAAWWRIGAACQRWLFTALGAVLLIVPPAAAAVQAAVPLGLPLPLAPLAAPAAALGLACLVVAAAAGVRRDRLPIAAGLAMAAFAGAAAANAWRLEFYKPAPRAAAALATLPMEAPLATAGFDEPSLLFYLGPGRAPLERLGDDRAAVAAWQMRPGPGGLVAEARLLRGIALGARVSVVDRVPGFNYSRGRPVELLVLARRAGD